MQIEDSTLPPLEVEDKESAQRVFEEFLVQYHPLLRDVEHYLEELMQKTSLTYAEAYKPWHKALHEMIRGVFLTVKNIPLPDVQGFLESLRLFCFDGAIQFLQDLCISCQMQLARNWAQNFKRHIDRLLFAAAILFEEQKKSLVPQR